MHTNKFSNFIAYIALSFIAICLVVKYLFTNFFSANFDIAYWCDLISNYLALIATLVCAFVYAKSRRNSFFMFFLLIFIGVIIVFNFVL